MARGLSFPITYRLITGNDVFVHFIGLWANAAHFHYVRGLFKWTILFPVINNALSIGWPDTFQGTELIQRGFVDIDFYLILSHDTANSRSHQKSN